MKKISLLFILASITLIACGPTKYPDLGDGVYAEFVTNKGNFVAKLYNEATPLTVANFVSLAEGTNSMVDTIHTGKKFFNGLTFHRVMKDFMIQGGDHLGTGMGNPGYKFPDEFVDSLKHDRKGILSMANGGPNMNGSQFFITLKDTPWLDGFHTVFGEIVIGQEIVDAIGVVETLPGDKPKEEVTILEVNIIRKGNVKIASFEDEMNKLEEVKKQQAIEIQKLYNETISVLNTELESAEVLETGLKFAYIKKGDGTIPKQGDMVMLEYEGYFINGELFDSSNVEITDKFGVTNLDRKNANQYGPIPIPFSPDAGMVQGFKDAMLKMRVGDQIIIYMPSHLGYGERGRGSIGPNTDMIFRMKMIGIKDQE